ncbi:DUF2779 domain-containing protein [Candidatus Woesearchaeota archaeon]|nr:DUF2779 domain-containing protein [Candidatus Woesearchaeota archaeon]
MLSKSAYLTGLQCPKYLWIKKHKPESIPEPDLKKQHLFDQGDEVGHLAKTLFPKGIDIPTDPWDQNLNLTKKLLKQNKVLFEAGIAIEGLYSRADILKPGKKGWDIIEVKSSTAVKDVNLHDVAFQKYVYEKAGLTIHKCFLLHINNKYVRKGEIDVKQLFTREDITEEVKEMEEHIEERITYMLDILSQKQCPKQVIGPHCSDPYECPLTECFGFLPEHNVLQLYRGKKRCWELIEDGVLEIHNIPEDFKLTGHQDIQRKAAKTKKPHIDKEGIKHFLKTIKEPAHYLDFETFAAAIPMFDNTRPYQQIPFQYSLHVGKEHHSYIADMKEDPRRDFLKHLKAVIKPKGSIVVYNQSFEKGRLKELAELFPKEKILINSWLDRIVDLIIPFRNFYYYHPDQKGSASVKDVLPVLTKKTYKELNIQGGEEAYLKYLYAIHDADEEEKERIFKDLEKYCGLDTEAMVLILEKLKQLV